MWLLCTYQGTRAPGPRRVVLVRGPRTARWTNPVGRFLDLTQKFVNPGNLVRTSRDDRCEKLARKKLGRLSLDFRPPLRPARQGLPARGHPDEGDAQRRGSRRQRRTRSSGNEERQAQGAADEERVEEYLRRLLVAAIRSDKDKEPPRRDE